MVKNEEHTGIILAGGKSSRMGRDKGLIKIKGVPLIQLIINQIQPYFSELMIVSNEKSYKQFGVRVVEDSIINKGPLAGIYSGLNYSTSERNVFFSCDNPVISTKMIDRLFQNDKNKAMAFLSDGFILPFPGLYLKESSWILKNRILNNELSVKGALKELKAKFTDLEDVDANYKPLNLNQPADIERYEEN